MTKAFSFSRGFAVASRKRKLPSISSGTVKSFFRPLPAYVPSVGENDVGKRRFFIETLGCQMNVADSEVVSAILTGINYVPTSNLDNADLILLNTCSIREGAENKALERLRGLRKKKGDATVGVLGCMAERLKSKLIEETKLADLVVGPDAYRSIPALLDEINSDDFSSTGSAVNVNLSYTETYGDIKPVRTDPNGIKALISIARGCNNMCSYCIVPHTRGRERSRDPASILNEVKDLASRGFKEITLLGQNVNSYFYKTSEKQNTYEIAAGFNELYNSRHRRGDGVRFADLLNMVASVDKEVRIRFTSPHPKDFSPDVIEAVRTNHNICNSMHVPIQSGSTKILQSMRRYHTKEAYLELIADIRASVPDIEFSSDFISGFCGESEEDHMETIDVLQKVGYSQAFLFAYSSRETTHAARKLVDDVPSDVKKRRLRELIATYRAHGAESVKKLVGEVHLVLIEGRPKRDEKADGLMGKTNGMRTCILQKTKIHDRIRGEMREPEFGDYVAVQIHEASIATLKGEALYITTLQEFYAKSAYAE